MTFNYFCFKSEAYISIYLWVNHQLCLMFYLFVEGHDKKGLPSAPKKKIRIFIDMPLCCSHMVSLSYICFCNVRTCVVLYSAWMFC